MFKREKIFSILFVVGLPVVGALCFQYTLSAILFMGFYLIFARIMSATYWLAEFSKSRKVGSLLCALAVKPDPLDGFDEFYGAPLNRRVIISDTTMGLYWDLCLGLFVWLWHDSSWGAFFLLFAGLEFFALLYFLITKYQPENEISQ